MALVGNTGSRPSSSTPVTLDDLRLFLSFIAPGWHTFYSADIGVWSGASKFYVTMKRRYVAASESCFGLNRKEETSRTFHTNLDFFEVIRTMVACPTWTRGDFVFDNESDFVPEVDALMVKLFSLLGSSRSLSTLNIMFYRFYHTHLPKLLGELHFLETLTLDARPMSLPEHAESIAEYFEQNSTLKSCTLVLDSCDLKSASHSSLVKILRPFVDAAQCAALKELVLRITPSQEIDSRENIFKEKLVCTNCLEAVANLVRHNTSLVKFDLCCSYTRDAGCALVGSALEVNHTLKEFGFPCSVAGLKELVSPLVPNLSGAQANISLSTLKLFPTSDCRGVDFMNELARLLKANNTLKAVHVPKQSDGSSWPTWESDNLTAAKYVERMTWRMLKSMMDNELRVNTSLNSLVLGNWTLYRVDGGWDLSYGGPCLTTLTNTADYFVVVEIKP